MKPDNLYKMMDADENVRRLRERFIPDDTTALYTVLFIILADLLGLGILALILWRNIG